MGDRAELMEVMLDSFGEGIALFGMDGEIVLWNQAAEAITGYSSAELVGHEIPQGLEMLGREKPAAQSGQRQRRRGMLVNARHRHGHEMPAITRVLVLRDGLGERIGKVAVFHPAEGMDALPHGITGDGGTVSASQAELEERLRAEFEDCASTGLPFGVLWVNVDQAERLRKTHGPLACEAMLEKVEQAMSVGLRATEVMGRWGEDGFLILSHEQTPEKLATHAQVLAGLAKTADFKWWGDRIAVTVSIGSAQACREDEDEEDGLVQLLERARGAIEASRRAGGNCVTPAAGRRECLPS